MRRSLVRDQGEEIGRQVLPFATAFKTWRYRSTRASRPGRLSRRGRPTLQSYKRIRERFPDTGVSGLPLETQGVAITQLLSCELRAGAVKARRPRADTRVGGAKRRALHGAEHRSSIEGVMVSASDEVQLVALMRAQKRATIVVTADAAAVASSRAERVRLCVQDFPHKRDQIVRTKWPRLSTTSAAQFTAFVDKATRSSAPTPTLTAMA